jgi:two-component system LytT family response regulator
MNTIRALIVDDEAAARRRIKQFLSDLPEVEVVGECEDGQQAVAFIREHAPDLVFLDVQMPRMNGFNVIVEVGAELIPAVIFVTAYDQFAIRAFEVHAVDYLLKPFNRERFRQAVERAVQLIRTAQQGSPFTNRLQELCQELVAVAEYKKRLQIKAEGRLILLDKEKIDWVETVDNHLRLHVGRELYAMRGTMSYIESVLDPRKFVRIHRSTLVNIDRIKEMQPLFNGDQLLILDNGTQLPMSRTYRERLQSLL